MLTLLGVFLLIAPFWLVFYFQNRHSGFLKILVSTLIFNLILAIISQYYHFFNYSNILIIHSIVVAILIIWSIKNQKRANFKLNFNWPLLLALAIIVFQLFSVHFLYNGTINTIDGHQTVTNFSYPFPYFADEWAGVAFTDYSIENKALPLVNPLIDGPEHYNFPNIFVGFFSLLAELFLILNIAPLLGFVPLSIISGTLLCYLVYLLLRVYKVAQLPAIIAMLTLPWIANSAKLPGIWYLFPFILGVILLLIGLSAIGLKDKKLFLISNLVALFIYPPLIVFVAPVLLLEFLSFEKTEYKKIIKNGLILLVGLSLTTALVFFLQPAGYSKLITLFSKSFFRLTYEGTIPTRFIWQVLPIITLPFSLLGIIKIGQKKLFPLFASIITGLALWLFCSVSLYYFIIDYARVAAIASYLMIIAFGFGLAVTLDFINSRIEKSLRPAASRIFIMVSLAFFLGAAFFYTQSNDWKNIRHIYYTELGPWQAPIEAPANNYLNRDDLRLFKNISQARFYSLPWKALVIGAATHNYPVTAKGSTITNFLFHDWVFLDSDCYGKDFIAEEFNIKYVYLPPFDCPNFIYLDKSSEGLYLYEYRK